jgi:hypothetical protein
MSYEEEEEEDTFSASRCRMPLRQRSKRSQKLWSTRNSTPGDASVRSSTSIAATLSNSSLALSKEASKAAGWSAVRARNASSTYDVYQQHISNTLATH